MFVTAAGNVGIGTTTPVSQLEVAGNLTVSAGGVLTGNGSGLTNVNAGNLTSGTIPSSALSGVNGSGLTNLTAANLTGTLPAAALPSNVALQNAANAFSAPQSINAAPSGTGVALQVGATGTTGVNGLIASTNDPAGNGAIITNTGSASSPGRAYILTVVDSTGNNGLRVNGNGLELYVPIAERIPNDATGTTLNTLVMFTNSGTVETIPTSGAFNTGAIGIVVADAGTSGKATVALTGTANCIFDNQTGVGDYVVPSITVVSSTPTAGDCHDYGAANGLPKYPLAGVQIVGRVLTANTGAGTSAQIYLYGYETRAIGQISSVSFTGQTAAIPANTLFTPLINGLFRVNVYMTATSGTTCSPQPCIKANLGFQDENGAQSLSFAQIFQVKAFVQQSVLVRSIGGQPITFSTMYSGTDFAYEAFVTIERVQ
jgi:hypothetical protein